MAGKLFLIQPLMAGLVWFRACKLYFRNCHQLYDFTDITEVLFNSATEQSRTRTKAVQQRSLFAYPSCLDHSPLLRKLHGVSVLGSLEFDHNLLHSQPKGRMESGTSRYCVCLSKWTARGVYVSSVQRELTPAGIKPFVLAQPKTCSWSQDQMERNLIKSYGNSRIIQCCS